MKIPEILEKAFSPLHMRIIYVVSNRVPFLYFLFHFNLVGKDSNSNVLTERGSRLGRCKWFNVFKGFGFLVPEDGSREVFVHQVKISCEFY